VTFRDESWNERQLDLEEGLSELLQHEIDHLDGILAVQRAIDEKSFGLARQINTP
jgi:peptide deformylase